MKPQVLLVDGSAARLDSLAERLSSEFDCQGVTTVEQAVGRLSNTPWTGVVVNAFLDQAGSGAEVVQIVRESVPRAFRVLYMPDLTEDRRYDIQRILCPHVLIDCNRPDFPELIREALRNLLGPATEPVPAAIDTGGVWTAHAPITREFLTRLREAAEQDTPVYLYGEAGSGRMCAAHILCRWRAQWTMGGRPGRLTVRAPVPTLRVPSLRERLQDLPEIATRMLTAQAGRDGSPRQLGGDAVEELLAREWRGNIDELAAVLKRAGQRAGKRMVIEAADLPHSTEPRWRPSQYAKDEGQRDCLLRQLRTARTVSAAARLEGCTRANYIRLMRRLGILRGDIVEQRPNPPETAGGGLAKILV